MEGSEVGIFVPQLALPWCAVLAESICCKLPLLSDSSLHSLSGFWKTTQDLWAITSPHCAPQIGLSLVDVYKLCSYLINTVFTNFLQLPEWSMQSRSRHMLDPDWHIIASRDPCTQEIVIVESTNVKMWPWLKEMTLTLVTMYHFEIVLLEPGDTSWAGWLSEYRLLLLENGYFHHQ